MWFKFNNSALVATETDEFTEGFWDMGISSLKDFFETIMISTPISLQMTNEVMEKRSVLMVRSQNVEA